MKHLAFLAIFGMVALPAFSYADGCRIARVRNNVLAANQVAVVKNVAVVQNIVPVAVAVPVVQVLYGAAYVAGTASGYSAGGGYGAGAAGYGAGTATPGTASDSGTLSAGEKAILTELRSLRVDVDALKVKTGIAAPGSIPAPKKEEAAPVAPAASEVTAAVTKVFQQSCALCHSVTTAKADGGNFTLFDAAGSVRKFDDSELLSLGRMLTTGKMPKQNAKTKAAGIGPLTDAEIEVAQLFINAASDENRKARKTPAPAMVPPVKK
jgi:hypothetical protein